MMLNSGFFLCSDSNTGIHLVDLSLRSAQSVKDNILLYIIMVPKDIVKVKI